MDSHDTDTADLLTELAEADPAAAPPIADTIAAAVAAALDPPGEEEPA